MKTVEELLYFMRLCISQDTCNGCPYYIGDTRCKNDLIKDSIELIVRLKDDLDHLEASQEPVEAQEPWTREKILDTAKQYICGPREEAYGSPEKGFKLTASLWGKYLNFRCVPPNDAIDIGPEDVAIMMALLKISRLAATPDHMDGWIDIAGYAAIGGEIAGKEADQ